MPESMPLETPANGGTAGMPAISARGVLVRRGRRTALAGVDLEARAGRTLAIVGHNGSGKSTLLAVLAGVLRAQQGTVVIEAGGDPAVDGRARQRIGYLPQQTACYPELSVRATLRHAARLRRAGGDCVEAALEQWSLGDHASRLAGHLSIGLLRRLGLALATLGEPPIVLLDEPHAGLDAAGRALFRAWAETGGDDRTLVQATHEPAAALRDSDDIVVLHEGRATYTGATPHHEHALLIEMEIDVPVPTNLAKVRLQRDDSQPSAWLASPIDGASPGEVVAELVHAGFGIRRVVPALEAAEDRLRALMARRLAPDSGASPTA